MSTEALRVNFLLILFAFSFCWLFLVAWVNIDVKRKERKAKLWNSLVFFLGPVGILLYECSGAIGKKEAESTSPDSTTNIQFEKKDNDGTSISQPEGSDQEILTIVKEIFREAVNNRATDIHLEPTPDKTNIRFRIDGYLQECQGFPPRKGGAIISAIKVLGNMDVAKKMTPQDGSFPMDINQQEIHFRVATSTSRHGETMAIRVLNPQQRLWDVSRLGLLPEVENRFRYLVQQNRGLILITGPAGCGKTTTLYAILNGVDRLQKNVISIEDPIEYNIENVTQIPINTRAGVTFVNSLKNILRQDPDVIMVGEIRDVETSQIAVEASLTGHLVFSTLHTTTAVNTIARLIEMGIDPYLISSSLVGVVSQRLVRLICSKCKESYILEKDEYFDQKETPLPKGQKVCRGAGCAYCKNTGYRDRIGVFEVLVVDEDLQKLISNKTSSEEIFHCAKQKGLVTILEDSLQKVRRGLTTIEEIKTIL